MSQATTPTDADAEIPDVIKAGWEFDVRPSRMADKCYVVITEAPDKSTSYAIGAMQEHGWSISGIDFDERTVTFWQYD